MSKGWGVRAWTSGRRTAAAAECRPERKRPTAVKRGALGCRSWLSFCHVFGRPGGDGGTAEAGILGESGGGEKRPENASKFPDGILVGRGAKFS